MTIDDPVSRFQRAAHPEQYVDADVDEYLESLQWAEPPPESLIDDIEPQPADERLSGQRNLPEWFWRERLALSHIKQAAHSRARSADAVLGNVLARVSALTPPSYCLPALAGAPAPLSMFVANVGPPGSGKSSAKSAATELLPYKGVLVSDDLPLGSGEGLIEAYFDLVEEANPTGKGANIKVKRHTRYGAFVFLDEGQVMAELGSRKGSTLMPMLRTAWSGSTLGTTNASIETRRRLLAGTYAIGLVAAFQPSMAADLLGDEAGGTPQRFEWCMATDPAIPDILPDWPGQLDWEPPEVRSYSGIPISSMLGIDSDVARDIQRTAIQRSRGQLEVQSLDAHADLARLKAAGVFCVLDGRFHITADDWELAGVYRETSRAVRDWVVRSIAVSRQQAELAVIHRHVSREGAVLEDRETRILTKMSGVIARHVHKNHSGPDAQPCTPRCARNATSSEHRKLVPFEQALELASSRGLVDVVETVIGVHITPGALRPA